MSETHINAYYANVDEAKQRLDRAQGEYYHALDELEEKKRQVGLVENKEPEKEADKPAEPVSQPQPQRKK